ncbi:MAG: HAD family phosphatase [Puniceicoccales bacterium]|jgi:HAD superfamily hydrolase (TIGR01509 family)|nr:HAD family phosphatase [Puniceicoccales bacterium]
MLKIDAPAAGSGDWTVPAGNFDAYIFDCDGTLAETMRVHYAAWLLAVRNQTGSAFHLEWSVFCSMGGMSTRDTLDALQARYGVALDEARLRTDVEKRLAETLDTAGARPEALALARSAASAGIKLAVASGGHRRHVERTLQNIGATDLFPVVVTLDDVSRAKPAPDLFLLAARRLGVPPAACLVIEDSPLGLAAAQAAGMRCLLVEPR